MTDRKKLIEVLDRFSFSITVNGETLADWNIPMPQIKKALVDHLLANGVTFATDTNVGSKWIPVTEKLPEHDVDVLCWYEYFRFGNYNKMYQTYGVGYCINGCWGGEVAAGTKCRVLAWMPLPEPPREE